MKRLQKFQDLFRARQIFFRLIAGYLLIVFFPLLIFGSIYLHSMNERYAEQLAIQEQYWLSQNALQLHARLDAISDTAQTLQFSDTLLNFLKRRDSMTAIACDYIVDILPLLTRQLTADPHMLDIYIHQENETLNRFQACFLPLEFENNQYKSGAWSYEIQPEHLRSYRANDLKPFLVYRKNFMNENYRKWLGVFEIRVNASILHDSLSTGGITSKEYLLLSRTGEIHQNTFAPENMLSSEQLAQLTTDLTQDGSYIMDGRLGPVHSIYLSEIDSFYITFNSSYTEHHLSIGLMPLMAVLIALLLLFSLFYMLIVGSMFARIAAFSVKLRTMNADHLQHLTETHPRSDEIGYLYSSHNILIDRIHHLINRIRHEERLREAAAYASMQSKIEPHFLYGTLETIRMMALQNHDLPTASLTLSFSKLMRYSLGYSDQVTLKQEIDCCRSYLDIQKTRLGKRLDFDFEILTDPEKVICPRFTLQPIVENAIHHGVSRLLRDSYIHIRIADADEQLVHIVVADNGTGMSPETLAQVRESLSSDAPPMPKDESSNGFALKNVHRRLQYFYSRECGLRIDSIEGRGTTVTVILGREESAREC